MSPQDSDFIKNISVSPLTAKEDEAVFLASIPREEDNYLDMGGEPDIDSPEPDKGVLPRLPTEDNVHWQERIKQYQDIKRLSAPYTESMEMSNEERLSRVLSPTPTAGQEAIHEDFIPAMVAGMALTPLVGGAIGMGIAGRTVGSRIWSGIVQSGLATAAEGFYIKPIEEIAGEISPSLKPIAGILTGIGSAMTVEALGARFLTALFTKTPPKFWSEGIEEALESGLIDKAFAKQLSHIEKRIGMGEPAAMEELEYLLKVKMAEAQSLKASEKIDKLQRPLKAEPPPTEEVVGTLSKKKALTEDDIQLLSDVAKRDAIQSYEKEFKAIRKKIIDDAIEEKTETIYRGVTQRELDKVLKGESAGLHWQTKHKGAEISADLASRSEYRPKDFGQKTYVIEAETPIGAAKLGYKFEKLDDVKLLKVYDAKTGKVVHTLSKSDRSVRRRIVANEYREEIDRIYRDGLMLKIMENDSKYLGRLLGTVDVGKVSLSPMFKTATELMTIEKVIKEIPALRRVTRELNNIMIRETRKEMTEASKKKIKDIRQGFADKIAEWRIALKVKNQSQLMRKRLTNFQSKKMGMPNEFGEQMHNFLAPMFGKARITLDETMEQFLTRKSGDEFSIGTDILMKKYSQMLKSMPGKDELFKEFTFEQIRDVDDFAKALQFVGKNERVISYKARQMTTDMVADTIYRSALEGRPKVSALQPRVSKGQLADLAEPAKGKIRQTVETTADLTDGFLAVLKRIEHITKQLDGFEQFGTAWQHIANKTTMAYLAKEALGKQVSKGWNDMFKAHRIATGMGRRTEKYWTATSGNLGGYHIDKESAVAMALNMGNKGNKEAMLTGLKVTEDQMNLFLKGALNEHDQKLVTDTYDLLDDMFPIMAKTYKAMTGKQLQKIPGGRYYPIAADKKYMSFRNNDSFENLFSAETNYLDFVAAVERGMTKARIGGVTSVKLTLRPLTQHLEDVVHMVTHWQPLSEIQRLTRHPKFRSAVEETMGKKIYAQFAPWLKNLARPNLTAYSEVALERVLSKGRRNVTIAALGAVPKVGLKQTLSLLTAIPVVGKTNTMASSLRFLSNPRRFIRAIEEASPEMGLRSKTWHRELAEMATKYNHKGSLKGGAANVFFKFIRFFDRITSSVVWHAGYLKGLQEFTDNGIKAVNFANDAVRMTQPTSAMKDLPYIMRSGETNRFVTLFYSYYSMFHNQADFIVRKGLAGKASFPEILNTVAWLTIAPATALHVSNVAWSELTGRPHEDFNMYEFAKSVAVQSVAGVPVVRDVASAMFMGYDYRVSPVQDVMDEAVDTGQAIMKMFDEDKELTKYDKVSMAEFAGYLLGMPSRQMITVGLAAQRLYDNETDDLTEMFVRPKYEKGQ